LQRRPCNRPQNRLNSPAKALIYGAQHSRLVTQSGL
jgi:hypothetical protein